MLIKGLKQIDVLKKIEPICEKYGIKMGSNDLSQYVTGKVEPSQKKLSALAEVLETNEVWLMGYDVPMEANSSKEKETLTDNLLFNTILENGKTEKDRELLYKSSKLYDNNKSLILNNVNELLKKQENYYEKDEITGKLYDPYTHEYRDSDIIISSDKKEDNTFSEFDLLFDKHKDILSESDKNIIKAIIEQRKKEIDKERGGE